MDRFAKALGALLILVLIKPWGLRLDWQRLSYASLAVTGLWIVMAMLARREYLKTFRRSIGARYDWGGRCRGSGLRSRRSRHCGSDWRRRRDARDWRDWLRRHWRGNDWGSGGRRGSSADAS